MTASKSKFSIEQEISKKIKLSGMCLAPTKNGEPYLVFRALMAGRLLMDISNSISLRVENSSYCKAMLAPLAKHIFTTKLTNQMFSVSSREKPMRKIRLSILQKSRRPHRVSQNSKRIQPLTMIPKLLTTSQLL